MRVWPETAEDARIELDVPTQVKLVRDIIEVALVLWLARRMFFPVPFLQEFFSENEYVGVVPESKRAPGKYPLPGAAHAAPSSKARTESLRARKR